MEQRILTYRKYMDDMLVSKDEGIDWNQVREQHLIQVGFFQHERFIHLIVTVLFALLEVISIALFTVVSNMSGDTGSSITGVGALCIVILILLVPYIRHYYILENEVQKMYVQYDKICAKCGLRDIFSL